MFVRNAQKELSTIKKIKDAKLYVLKTQFSMASAVFVSKGLLMMAKETVWNLNLVQKMNITLQNQNAAFVNLDISELAESVQKPSAANTNIGMERLASVNLDIF